MGAKLISSCTLPERNQSQEGGPASFNSYYIQDWAALTYGIEVRIVVPRRGVREAARRHVLCPTLGDVYSGVHVCKYLPRLHGRCV